MCPPGEIWAAERRPRGRLLPQGALSMRDAPPIFFLRHQKENAPRPVEKKKCSAGRSAPAQTSCRRRGMVGTPLQKSGTETRCPWGNFWPGEVGDTLSLSPRCRSRFFEEQPAAAKIGAETMRRPPRQPPHHPPRDGSCNLAEESGVPESQFKSALAPIRRPPSRAEGHCTGARLKRFFLFHRARRILFLSRTKREWGAHCPAGNPAESPGRLITAPTAPGRPAHPATGRRSPPGRSVWIRTVPAGPTHSFDRCAN